VYRSVIANAHEIWWDRGGWWWGDLTDQADAPLAEDGPYGYAWDDQRTHHVLYRSPHRHAEELTWRA
jgi:hypothetical protein